MRDTVAYVYKLGFLRGVDVDIVRSDKRRLYRVEGDVEGRRVGHVIPVRGGVRPYPEGVAFAGGLPAYPLKAEFEAP